jgi:hypothetical protein
MTGDNKAVRGDLDVYFNSKRFIKRLDEIRGFSSDPIDLKAYASNVADKSGMLIIHTGVVWHYLITGKYDPSKTTRSQIQIIDKGRRMAPQSLYPEQAFQWINDIENVGVLIEIDGETSQEELIAFVSKKKNWAAIKEALDANYTKRKKLFRPVKRIDDYLAVADKLNRKFPRGDKTKMEAKLSDDYNIDIADIRRIAKHYRTIY